MIWRIAKKEFLLNVMTFKFAVATVACVVLTAVFTPILAKDYEQRLRTYRDNVARNEAELQRVKVYMNIVPTIYRPPSVLSVFSEGLEKRISDSVTIEVDQVPELRAAATHGNPYQSIFPVFDISLVSRIVISVLALLVAYDAISGERERGTLKLMLSNTTRRHQVLLAKLLAGLLVLVIPITMVFIVVLILLLSFPMVDLARPEWARIGLMYFASLIFVSAMYNVGLLLSCLTRKSAIALVLGLFLWILFAAVVPNGSVYLAAQMRPLEPREEIDGRMMSLKHEYDAELNKSKPPQSDGGSQSGARDAFGRGYDRLLDKTAMEYRQKSYRVEYPLKIRYADKYSEVERRYLDSLWEQKNLADSISRISPIPLYGSVMSTLAGTDLAAFRHFMKRVRTHRAEIVEYIRSETEDFSSPLLFTRCTQEEMAEYEEMLKKFIMLMKQAKSQAEIAALAETIKEWVEKRMTETPSLDLQDCPRFASMTGDLGELRQTIPAFSLLLFINLTFFALSFAAFMTYDVR